MTDHIETLRAMLESPVWIGAPEDRDALQAAIRAIESLRGGAQPTTVPREPAPPSSLPDWSECQMRCANSDYVAKRKEEGGHGEEPGGMYANELHRFIYEYDDADRYRSEWFMYRLEKLIEFIRSTTPERPTPSPTSARELPEWLRRKPERAGVFEVRGWEVGDTMVSAIVCVDFDDSGELVCNLHECNSESDRSEWSRVADYSDRFEWRFIASNVPTHDALQAWEGVK